jgi:hypothetical protein
LEHIGILVTNAIHELHAHVVIIILYILF